MEWIFDFDIYKFIFWFMKYILFGWDEKMFMKMIVEVES